MAAAVASTAALAQTTTPAALQSGWERTAGRPAQAAAGGAFFKARHGGEWSCASCHGPDPRQAGRHAVTGKRIEPLAPAANAQAFTDEARVEKWMRRNCRDVLDRACTPAEKADVLAWLRSL